MNGESMRVHSFVLAFHFDGLQNLLKERAAAVSRIVQYAYTGTITLNLESAAMTYFMSSFLRSSQLREWCSSFLKKR